MPADAELWETAEGIEVFRHPTVLINEDPALWALTDEWRAVGPVAISREDYRTRSARWVDGWQMMLETFKRRRTEVERE